jgi:XTP/dITP diphosphohydrolase
MKITLATKNAGKAAEIGRILEGSGVEIVSLQAFPFVELPPETGKTLRENALLKARHVFKAAGLPALADDSGLEVDFLGGAPGVYSARYSGEKATDEENWRKLLRELDGVAAEKRSARFRCALALVFDDDEHLFEGVFEGSIAEAPRGLNGFGYDPVFIPLGMDMTAAELAPEEKNRISHRARALEALKVFLAGRF